MKNFTPILIAWAIFAGSSDSAFAQPLTQAQSASNADFFDDFNDGVADNWLPLNASRWQISVQNGSPASCLYAANPNGDEYTVMNALNWSNFAMEVDAKSSASSNQNLFIAFGLPSPSNFSNYYYLRFAAGAVDLYRVFSPGSGVIIASAPGDFVSDNQYHRLRIERQTPSIKVYVDGQLILQHSDGTFTTGYVGFGSFKSTACFDNVSMTSSISDVGPVIFVKANILDDNFPPSRGDNDGRAESCELLELEVTLKNIGTTTATNVGVPDLSCADPDITVIDSSNCWLNIAGGETKNNECQFLFKVNPTLTQNKTVIFSMTIYADNGGPWTSTFPVNVYVQDQGQYFCGAFEALEGVSSSAVAWADVIGNDGRLDFLVIGRDDYLKEITQFYRNDQGGYFTDVSAAAALNNVHGGSLAWGNFDNDNEADLDLLLTGAAGSARVTQIYRYDGGGRFTAIADNLPDISNGTGVWGDYDNDGDLDILLAGSSSLGNLAEIYKNTKGVFTPVNAGLKGVAGGSAAAWGDYDNDGDLDILLAGEESSGLASAKIYRNTNGVFNDIAAPLTGVADCALAWGDYDSDGNLDILLAGRQSNGVRLAKVYRNTNGSFFDVNASLVGIDGGSAVWGDFDNDGDLDILLTGDAANGPVAKVYRNDGIGFYDIQAALTGVKISAAAWGDYDNDGALDVIAAGEDGGGALSVQVYRNIVARANTAPTTPANLTSSPSGSSVTLNWNKATDNQTRQNGLTYNLRVGTTMPNGPQIVSPLSNVTNGFRRVPQLGNTGHPNSLTIKNLAPGTYYWSVQAIDNAFAGSAFAPERNFVILPTPTISRSPATMTFTGLTGGANPASQTLQISNSGGGTLNWSVSANQTWLTLSPGSGSATGEIDNVSVSANIAGLAAGTYSATITIAAPGATNTPQTTAVIFNIAPQLPTISRSPDNMTFTAVAGGPNPTSQTLQISNSGGGTLNWSVSANQTWLTLSPSSGSSTGEIDNVNVSANIAGLGVGIYSATITITAAGATNTPQQTAVTLNIMPPLPTIFRAPATMTFTAVAGGVNPASQTLQISNSGGGTLNWSVNANQTWLSLFPSSGSSTGEIDNVTVSVNIAGLAAGTYAASITISDAGATNTPQTATVTLMITPPPTISRVPAAMTFTAKVGGINPPSQTLQISNSGGGTLNWSVSANQTWLNLSPSSGSSTGETDEVAVSVNIAGLTIGTQSAMITISASGATNAPQNTTVTLNIEAQPPTIFRNPSTMTFNTVAGTNPPSQMLQISNSGGGTLSWSVSANQTWLSLSPSSGSSTGETDEVTVSVNIAGLAVGQQSATITISAAGATNTPLMTVVTLTIAPPPPMILHSPVAMSFIGVIGSGNPAAQTLQISNSGGGTLNWNVSSSQAWLSLSPISGTSTGETDNVTLSVNTVGLAPGMHSATITISAIGATNTPLTAAVSLTMQPNQNPVITPTPPNSPNANQAVLIQANVTDDLGIATVTLNYRRGGEAGFTSTMMTMTPAGSTSYQATILPNMVTSFGVEYFIEATDTGNPPRTARQPQSGVFSVPVIVSLLTKSEAQPAAGDQRNQTAYRLISVPLSLNNASAAAVLTDDLDAYDDTKWRLFDLDPNQPPTNKSPYREVSQSGVFTSGKSFFLIVREPNKQIDAGPGLTVATNKKFGIPLASGHNFVATPFNFEIPKAKLRLHSNGVVDLQTYTSGWATESVKLTPWEGYYLPINGAGDTLFVDPNFSSSPLARRTADGEWKIRILAHCGEAADTYNFAGVSSTSADGWDGHDLVEAPPIGEYVALYFPHTEWRKVFERYREDLRSTSTSNHQWRFVVESNIPNEMVNLRFEGWRDIDPSLAVVLVDEAMQYKQNLRENPVYQYQPRHLDRPQEFTLIVGKEDFVAEQTASVHGVPENFVLEQNFPNPFSSGGNFGAPETAIRFGLPRQSIVTIKIFDLAGHEVVTLLDRAELPGGRHQRVWDGRDAQGQPVVSGIYFCRLVAGGVAKTMKLLLAK